MSRNLRNRILLQKSNKNNSFDQFNLSQEYSAKELFSSDPRHSERLKQMNKQEEPTSVVPSKRLQGRPCKHQV